jgi:type II secretory pathway component PulF
MSVPDRSRQLHLAMLAKRARDIDATRRMIADPSACLPRWILLIATLTGTGSFLYRFLRQRLQVRLDRLQREQRALSELLRWQDQSRQI